MRTRLIVLTLLALILAACNTPSGQGQKDQNNTPVATAGAQNVGRSQGATSTITIGGDTTYNVNLTGSTANPALLGALEAINGEIANLPAESPPDVRDRLVAARERLIERLSQVPGVTITIEGNPTAGDADSAAASGETGIPPVTEPPNPGE